MAIQDLDLGKYQLGWSDAEDYVFKPKKGINEAIVREMSAIKKEPDWMRDFRLAALRRFDRRPMAKWFAVNMPDLDFDDIYYYIKPTEEHVREARHPRGRAQVPRWRDRTVRVRGRLPSEPG